MKRILFKLLKYVVISYTSLFLFGMFLIGNQFEDSYNASAIDKITRLKEIDEPKIILVGNSNVAFGFDSSLIERETGFQVVNLGLDAGLGNAVSENMCKYNINEGDIIVLCHTSYDSDPISDYVTAAWNTIEYHFDLYKIIRMKDVYGMIKSYPKYFIMGLSNCFTNKKLTKSSYERKSFNQYGDIDYRDDIHVDINEYNSFYVSVPSINKKDVERINKLNDYINKKGAYLLVAGYPIIYGPNTPSGELYDMFEEELRSELKCDVISNFRDYFIPYIYFYDTRYHLTKRGADMRTNQFINDISGWIARNYKAD